MTHDRVDADEFTLTQEFLRQMVGVRRATLNEGAVRFQSEGYMDYTRARVTILNRKALEFETCHCYRVIRGEYERMPGS